MSTTRLRAAFAAALFSAPAALAGAPPPREVLPFIADDYTQALAAARSAKKPIFLEAWAPW